MIVFMHSMDAGDTLAGKFQGITSAILNTTNARFPGFNSLVLGNTSILSVDTPQRRLSVAHQHATLGMGMAFRMEGAVSGDGEAAKALLQMRGDGGTTTHLTLTITTSGEIRVRRGAGNGTILGTSAAGIVTVDTWYTIALLATLHDTTGTVDVELNGANVLSLTGQDTKNGGTATVFDEVEWGSGTVGVSACRICDFIVWNGAGTENTDFPPQWRVLFGTATGDLTPEDWTHSTGTDSSALIDEATPNGDTDYIESDVVGEITRVNFTDLTDLTHAVLAIQTSMQARKDDAGARSARVGILSDATVANGVDHELGTSYSIYTDPLDLDPDGDIPWTPASVNAAALQVEVRT